MPASRVLQAVVPLGAKHKKRLGVLQPVGAQGDPVCTQACCPATVRTEWFALLCCQPQAVPTSSAARTCPLPRTRPCESVHLVRTRHRRVSRAMYTQTAVHQPSPRSGDRRPRHLPANYNGPAIRRTRTHSCAWAQCGKLLPEARYDWRKRIPECSRPWFRSRDLWVMSPTR